MKTQPAVVRGASVVARKVEFARELRQNQTGSEVRAWSLLRNRGLRGLKFRRQQLIGGFITDFYCAQLRLALEIDGGIHEDPEVRRLDDQKHRALERLGVSVLRVRNEDIALTTLLSAIDAHLASASQLPEVTHARGA